MTLALILYSLFTLLAVVGLFVIVRPSRGVKGAVFRAALVLVFFVALGAVLAWVLGQARDLAP